MFGDATNAVWYGETAMAARIKVGDIFMYSWGYDQTNIDFFKGIKTTEKTVTVQQIEAESVKGEDGFMTDECVPKRDVFKGRSKPVRKTMYPATDKQGGYCLHFDYGTGYLWDDKPQRRSWYG
jgi:hypothetical protein